MFCLIFNMLTCVQGLVVAILYCFLNSEVSTGCESQHVGLKQTKPNVKCPHSFLPAGSVWAEKKVEERLSELPSEQRSLLQQHLRVQERFRAHDAVSPQLPGAVHPAVRDHGAVRASTTTNHEVVSQQLYTSKMYLTQFWQQRSTLCRRGMWDDKGQWLDLIYVCIYLVFMKTRNKRNRFWIRCYDCMYHTAVGSHQRVFHLSSHSDAGVIALWKRLSTSFQKGNIWVLMWSLWLDRNMPIL